MSLELTSYLTAQHYPKTCYSYSDFFVFFCFYFQKIPEEERGACNINRLLGFFFLQQFSMFAIFLVRLNYHHNFRVWKFHWKPLSGIQTNVFPDKQFSLQNSVLKAVVFFLGMGLFCYSQKYHLYDKFTTTVKILIHLNGVYNNLEIHCLQFRVVVEILHPDLKIQDYGINLYLHGKNPFKSLETGNSCIFFYSSSSIFSQ